MLKNTTIKTAVFVLIASCVVWAASDREESIERLQRSGDVLKSIMDTPDKGVPEEVVDNAKCIVVVPNLVKGGFIVGAKHGRGVATCRTGKGWSAPAFVSVGGGSWGLQIGVEGVDLLMFVMNEKGLQHLLSSKFQISGEGSAAAGPVGRHASAGTDWKMDTEILTYSRSKGAFAGLTLEGAVIQQDDDSTKAVYGKEIPFRTVLTGQVPSPAVAASFRSALAAATRQATAAEAKTPSK